VFSLFIYYYYYYRRRHFFFLHQKVWCASTILYIIIILILHTSGVSDNMIYLNAVSITFHGGCYDIIILFIGILLYRILYLWSGRGQVADPRLYYIYNCNNSNTIIHRYDIIFSTYLYVYCYVFYTSIYIILLCRYCYYMRPAAVHLKCHNQGSELV